MKINILARAAILAWLLSGFAVAQKTEAPAPEKEEPVETPPKKGTSDTAQSGEAPPPETAPTRTRPTGSNDWMESHGQIPRFDLGGSFGYNNPAGMLGLEAEYRLYEFLGIGFHGGTGGWGIRLSPVVHAYPFGASNFGLYGEAAFSLNLGQATTITSGAVTSNVDLGWNPAVSLAVGYRRQWLTFFWTSIKLGYQWKIGGNNDYRVTGGSSPLNNDQELELNLLRPGTGLFGGLVFGGSAGIAFL